MYQIYFLSVFFNGLAGLVLSSDYISEKFSGFTGVRDLINGAKPKFTIGLIAFIIGALKLFAPVSGWLILGDLLPAFGGLLLGFILLMDFLRERSVMNSDVLVRIDSLVTSNKTAAGVIGLLIALLHFFFCGTFIL